MPLDGDKPKLFVDADQVLSPRKKVVVLAVPVPSLAVAIVPDVMSLAATANVPPRVRLPDVVTVPLKVIPETVPVPETLVTVPLPPPPPAGTAHVPSFLKKVVVLPVGAG